MLKMPEYLRQAGNKLGSGLDRAKKNLKIEDYFSNLKYSAYMNTELLRWTMAAGITKHVTFHSGRHTFAVSLLCNGVDIYTVSKLMGHNEVKTTQVYADIIDSVRKDAMHKIPDIGL